MNKKRKKERKCITCKSKIESSEGYVSTHVTPTKALKDGIEDRCIPCFDKETKGNNPFHQKAI